MRPGVESRVLDLLDARWPETQETRLAGDERLRRGRECYARRAWREARDLLAACDAKSPLQVADLEKLAVASFLLAEDVASDDAWTRAHQLHLQAGNRPGAVRCAFWLVFRLLNAGDLPSASGWIARMERLLWDEAEDLPKRGHLTYLTGFFAILSGDLLTAEADLGRSVRIAERCADLDLSTLARLALGRVLIFRGDVSGGVPKTVGYWIENAVACHARYYALDDNIKQSLEARRQSDRPRDEIEAVYDEQLTTLGL